MSYDDGEKTIDDGSYSESWRLLVYEHGHRGKRISLRVEEAADQYHDSASCGLDIVDARRLRDALSKAIVEIAPDTVDLDPIERLTAAKMFAETLGDRADQLNRFAKLVSNRPSSHEAVTILQELTEILSSNLISLIQTISG